MKRLFRIIALLMAALMVMTSCQAPDSGSQLTDGTVDVSFAGPSARTITTDDGLVQTVATSDLWFQYKAEWQGEAPVPSTAKPEWTSLPGPGLSSTVKLHRGRWNLSLRAFVNQSDVNNDSKFILSGTKEGVEIGTNNLVTQTVSINLGYVRQEGNGTLHVSATYPVVYHEAANSGDSPVEAVRKVKVTANVAGTDYTGDITAFNAENVGTLDLTVPAGAAHVTVQYYMDDNTLFEDDKTAKDVLIMATMTTNLAVSVDRDITAVTFKAEQPEGTVEDNVIPKVFNSIFDIYPGNLRNNEVVIGYAEETKALEQTPITYPYEICTAAEKDEKDRYTATSLGLTPIIVTNQTALKDSGATAIWRGPGSFNFTETNEFVEEVHFSDNASSSGGGYSYLTNLKKVVIGNGFTGIGSGAFKNCKNLTEVVIPDSVRSLGYVNKSSSSPSGDGAFQGCTSLETINLPEGLITIGDNTFLGCSSIDNIIIPLTVTEFGEDAFHGCSSLTSIIIPEGVETLSEWMFYGCTNLESVILPETLTTIGFGAFQNCEKIESINIPSNVSKISAQAFLDCKGITSVTIPSGATITGHSAFSGCSSLESVIFCDGVTSTGDQTFEHCSSLTSVILPDSITYIGNNTFSNGCYGLSSSSITIPENITTLYSSAIQPGCAVVYKGTVEQWNSKKLDTGDRRDIQCTDGKPLMRIYYDKSSGETYFRGLTPYGGEVITNTDETLVIPDGVTIISASYGLKNCSVKKLVVPTSVQRIFSNLFADAKTAVELINYNGTVDEWLSIRMGTGLPSNINISCSDGYVPCIIYTPFPEGSDTQSYWDSLTIYGKTFTEVTFSNRSPRIGSYVLSGSYNSSNNVVEKVVVEEGVTKIDSCAFANCSNLSEIVLPSTITSIGSEIFKNSNNVSNIYINMSQEGHETLFDNAAIPSGCTITWNSPGPESI